MIKVKVKDCFLVKAALCWTVNKKGLFQNEKGLSPILKIKKPTLRKFTDTKLTPTIPKWWNIITAFLLSEDLYSYAVNAFYYFWLKFL